MTDILDESVSLLSLDKTSVELTEGDETTLTATITPENATNKNITWTSSDENIVTVDNGKVTAIKEGTATIAVTTEDGNKSATCEVIVFADEIMKEMCVNAFDTNGNGELSYKEAEAITDLSKMVLSNKTFKSFDEFQYFISVRDIPDNYFRESNLKSITLPSSIISIGEGHSYIVQA